METTGLVLALYRQRFGTVPVAVAGDAAPLDVAAAWTEDRTALTVAVVNPTDEARADRPRRRAAPSPRATGCASS